MKKKFLLIGLITILLIPFVYSAMDPSISFCEHQGYKWEHKEGYRAGVCIFDNGNECDLLEFYRGTCGQEYRKEFPCRKKGELVFSQFEECCPGLKRFLPPGMIGQSTCQPFFHRLTYNLLFIGFNFWYMILGIIALIAFLIYLLKRRKKE